VTFIEFAPQHDFVRLRSNSNTNRPQPSELAQALLPLPARRVPHSILDRMLGNWGETEYEIFSVSKAKHIVNATT
jgi:hypothetical protein